MYVTWKHTWMYEYIKWKKSIEKDAKQLKLLHSTGMSISYYSHIENNFTYAPTIIPPSIFLIKCIQIIWLHKTYAAKSFIKAVTKKQFKQS